MTSQSGLVVQFALPPLSRPTFAISRSCQLCTGRFRPTRAARVAANNGLNCDGLLNLIRPVWVATIPLEGRRGRQHLSDDTVVRRSEWIKAGMGRHRQFGQDGTVRNVTWNANLPLQGQILG
jgi:hypothetical protein